MTPSRRDGILMTPRARRLHERRVRFANGCLILDTRYGQWVPSYAIAKRKFWAGLWMYLTDLIGIRVELYINR